MSSTKTVNPSGKFLACDRGLFESGIEVHRIIGIELKDVLKVQVKLFL